LKSSLLFVSISKFNYAIDGISNEDLWDKVKIMIGGKLANDCGADGYSEGAVSREENIARDLLQH
jgi:methanogenic corrinoid protein MtbC1